jgi:hypothetical protein
MSIKAINDVLGSTVESPTDRLVLLVLANHLNGENGQCNPSIPRVARQCSLTERSIYNSLDRLEKQGHLSRVTGRGLNNSNHYRLHPKPEPGSPFEGLKPESHSGQNLKDVHPKPEPGSPKQERNRKLNQKGAKPLTLPFADAEFVQAWEQWEQHRREKKKPVTPTSASLQLSKLEAMGARGAVEAITHSIANGWIGIFPPKTHQPAKPKSVYQQL